MVVLLIVISSISVRIGIESFRNNWEHFEVISAQSGVILVGLIILVCFNIREGLSFKKMLLKEKGTPVDIEEAFKVGEIVKILAMSKYHKYALLKGLSSSTKAVRIPPYEQEHLSVGKHYRIGQTGGLIDFIREEREEALSDK